MYKQDLQEHLNVAHRSLENLEDYIQMYAGTPEEYVFRDIYGKQMVVRNRLQMIVDRLDLLEVQN